jgi:4-oxalocrotonate tautomerase
MPLINVKLIEDVFTPEQKQQIVETLTDAMVSIEGRAATGASEEGPDDRRGSGPRGWFARRIAKAGATGRFAGGGSGRRGEPRLDGGAVRADAAREDAPRHLAARVCP